MERIAIIGAAGSGKTTLAKKLEFILKINVYHLDRIFWQRDWKRIAEEDRIDILQNIVQRKKWIIEGKYLKSSELRLNAADTIIFLDISPLVCLRQVIKRHYLYNGNRRDLAMECSDVLNVKIIAKVLFFALIRRRMIRQKLGRYKDRQVIILHSTGDIDSFVAQVYDEANIYNLVPVG